MIPESARAATGALVLCLLVAAVGCSPIPELGETTAEDAYQVGSAAAERGDYLLAIEAFKRVTATAPLHEMADDALMGLADAHRAMSDYALAESEYRQLVSDYPRSPLVPEAEYKLGLTYYEQALPAELDQSMTNQAISQFERFLAAYPDSDFAGEARDKIAELRGRLAQKSYETADLYFSLGDPKAARVYLEAVVREYPDTRWAPAALLDMARSYADEGSKALAANAYQRLMDLYPNSDEARAAKAEKSFLDG